MTFLSPGRLWLLVAVAGLIAAYLLVQRRRTAYAVRFTNLDLLDRVAPNRPGWRRHVPAVAFLLMLVALVVSFARPTADARVPRERATVLVAVDVSNSMLATDVEPNRLAAAKEAAGAFVDRLPAQFNVGLVAFSGTASVVAAPTTDRAVVHSAIDALRLGPGTAIGEAVFSSLQAIATLDADAGADPPPARIVLMSDGSNTSGRAPAEAGSAASAAGVPVSTIAYGTADGTIELEGRSLPVPVDTAALESLAGATAGTAYTAATGEELGQVYADIGSSIGYRTERREIGGWFLGGGLALAALAAAASLAWFSRLP